jgi:hypothetical protein
MAFLFACASAGTSDSANAACTPCDRSSRFDDRCRLVTVPCERANIEDADAVLDALFASRQPVVLYVHGRGNEPRKTARQDIVGKLESQYGIKVLMFNWNSRGFLFSRPVDRARASAPNLRDTISRLGTYRDAHPETAGVPVSLLVHSMGSIVLRPALDGLSLANQNGPIFSNILITESDEDAQGHNAWVERLRARNAILLTFNESDSTVRRSNHGEGLTPLGLRPEPPLAGNAQYINATDRVGQAHRLFDKGRLHGNVALCEIFTAMLRGAPPDLTSATIGERQGTILIPFSRSDRSAPCFRDVIDLPDDDDDD